MNRTITITFTEVDGWDVHEDGKCCNGLGWDEMLGQVAVLTMPPKRVGTGYAMRTPQEWADLKMSRYTGQMQVDPPLAIEGPISF